MPSFSRSRRLKSAAICLLAGAAGVFLFPHQQASPAPSTRTGAVDSRAMIENGQYEEAIAFHKARLDRAGAAERDKLDSLRALTLLYWYTRQHLEAREAGKKAVGLAAVLRLPQELASAEAELAVLESCIRAINLKNAGDLAASNKSYEEAWLKSRSAGLGPFEIEILKRWSVNLLGSATIPKEYLAMNARALDLARALGFKHAVWSTENNIGFYHLFGNNYSQALSHFLGGWFYLKDAGPRSATFMCLSNIAEAYSALGDYAKARDYLSEAIAFLEPKSIRLFHSKLLIDLGETFLSLAQDGSPSEGYYDQALECFTSYLKVGRMAGGEILDSHALNGVARVRLAQGRIEEAEASLLPVVGELEKDKALAPLSLTLNTLAAAAMAKGRVDEAEGYYRRALIAAEKGNVVYQRIEADCGLGRTSERHGDFGQAVAFYNDAIRLIGDKGSLIANDVDQAAFLGRRRAPYQALVDLDYRLSGSGGGGVFEREMFRIAENFRAKSFLEQLERAAPERKIAGTDPMGTTKDRLEGERLELLRRLSRRDAGLDKAETEAIRSKIRHLDDLLDAGTRGGSGRTAATAGQAPAISLDMLQASILPERTALIEYFLGDERSFLMCVTSDDFRVFELPAASAVEDSLTAYLGFLEDPSLPAEKGLPAARRLYEELLRPALSRLPGVDRLVIVPDGVLFRLPFETLALGPAGASPAACLNDRYVVSYAPSAASLAYLMRAPAAAYAKEALALAVPEGGGASFVPGTKQGLSAADVLNDLYKRSGFTPGPIPYSTTEVEGLKKRLGPAKADVLVGERAAEAVFKGLDLEPYRLIHLACHSISDERYPLRSALVLAPGGGSDEDGFLQVSEMYGMRTRADLVVLSACQTGRGKIVRNEGVLGLPRVFFYMGARSVVATLWPVHDKAAALFMKHFYDAYFGGAGKAEALRTAKRKMAGTRYGHPYYWAAFTLTGEF